jgi:hypothetical protein
MRSPFLGLKCKTPAGLAGGSFLSLIQVWQVRRINPQFLEIYFAFRLCRLRRFPQGRLLTTFPRTPGLGTRLVRRFAVEREQARWLNSERTTSRCFGFAAGSRFPTGLGNAQAFDGAVERSVAGLGLGAGVQKCRQPGMQNKESGDALNSICHHPTAYNLLPVVFKLRTSYGAER